MGTTCATIKQLLVYPIKSCMGVQVPSATVTPLGLAWDRRWVVVDAVSGRFITQRQISKLCLVQVQLPPEALALADWGAAAPEAAMTITAPGMERQLLVRLQAPPMEGALRNCTVWEWSGSALDEGEDAAAWFTAYLGRPCRLVRHVGSPDKASVTGSSGTATAPADATRLVDPEFAPGAEVGFADGFPMLFATEEALAALNRELKGTLPMNRFRPNVVLAGGGSGWADDDWAGLRSGDGIQFDFVKPCSRCKVTTIDQSTGAEGKEPLHTLGIIRSGKELGWSEQRKSWMHAVFFGWNAVPSGLGGLALGDTLAVMPKAAA